MSAKLTQEEFIKRSNKSHNNKYDYSMAIYKTKNDSVIIICPIHKEFKQKAEDHMMGKGCSKCSGVYKMNQEEFIEKCEKLYPNHYNYSNVIYVDQKTHIEIICKIHNNNFKQVPFKLLKDKKLGCNICKRLNEVIDKMYKVHGNKYTLDVSNIDLINERLRPFCKIHNEYFEKGFGKFLYKNQGCQKCGKEEFYKKIAYTNEEFIDACKNKHNNFYDYSLVNYVGAGEMIIVICKEHGQFEVRANKHLNGTGCRKCAYDKRRFTNDFFLEEAEKVHGNRFLYDMVNYINADTKIKIGCSIHGYFEQLPLHHLNGDTCKQCVADSLKLSKEKVIELCKEKHGDKYDYSKLDYVNYITKFIVICKEHGEFKTKLSHFVNREQGCSLCRSPFVSKKETKWLDKLNIPNDLDHRQVVIKIANKMIKADGFDPITNTIYEFDGDFWHGNPNIYNQEEMNLATETTFGELYEKTLSKKELIKSARP